MAEMKKAHNIGLMCTDLSGLWSLYQQESLALCMLAHLRRHLRDAEIQPLIREAVGLSEQRLEKIRDFFREEGIPIPEGFGEGDVRADAPPLFHDPFALSYVYMKCRLSIISFSFSMTSNVRLDVLDFMSDCLRRDQALFQKAVGLMLAKGIYDRPPKINYPKEVEYIRKGSFLNGFIGKKRPLSALELSGIFFNIERNYFSVLLLLGLIQVVENEQIRKHLKRGKEISEKQISLFNKLMMDEELLGTVTVNMEVTDSTQSPFSDRLILNLVNYLNAVDVTLISQAMATALRADLVEKYARLTVEVMAYGKSTFDMLEEREWMEQPPLTVDRDALIRSK